MYVCIQGRVCKYHGIFFLSRWLVGGGCTTPFDHACRAVARPCTHRPDEQADNKQTKDPRCLACLIRESRRSPCCASETAKPTCRSLEGPNLCPPPRHYRRQRHQTGGSGTATYLSLSRGTQHPSATPILPPNKSHRLGRVTNSRMPQYNDIEERKAANWGLVRSRYAPPNI